MLTNLLLLLDSTSVVTSQFPISTCHFSKLSDKLKSVSYYVHSHSFFPIGLNVLLSPFSSGGSSRFMCYLITPCVTTVVCQWQKEKSSTVS
jgi:hypothetical protein